MQILSQYDPRWVDVKIGQSSLTLGRDGCAITSFCNAVNAIFKANVTPDYFAHDAACFTPGGLVLWEKVCAKTKLLLKGHTVSFLKRQDGEHDADILGAIKSPAAFVILNVNNGAHFVLAIGKSLFGNDFVIADPWGGVKANAKQKYHSITGARYFAFK